MFKRIRKALRRHPLGNERGQSTVEYILMLSVVVIVAINVLMEFQHRGISDLAGSAEGGIIYRMLVIQGHTYWNIDQLMLSGSAVSPSRTE